MFLVSMILLSAAQNLIVLSSDKEELMKHRRSLQISQNSAQTGNIKGAARPVGL